MPSERRGWQGQRHRRPSATAKEIAAVLGHTSLDEVETYTRDADQLRLADAAMARLIQSEFT